MEPLPDTTTDDELLSFYAARSEAERLSRGLGRLEELRTRELLARYLPAVPAVVHDIGGGTGHYACWLLDQGYTVNLLDPVPDHVQAARDLCPGLASAEVGDARALPWPDGSADAVLLMGPLYHLQARGERVLALREARRVLQENGVLFAVVIPRWASALVGMLRGWTYDPAYAAMVRAEITTGAHLRPPGWPQLFMHGFFHSIADIEGEVTGAGLELVACAAIEGPAWMSQDFDSAWEDEAKRERIVEIARLAEHDREVLATSPHVAVICRPAADTV